MGLLDDGNGRRYTPAYTKRNAKRYRYYVAHPGLQPNARALRIPAKELDTLVLQRMRQLLGEPLALLGALNRPDDDAGLLQGLLTYASARYQPGKSYPPSRCASSCAR